MLSEKGQCVVDAEAEGRRRAYSDATALFAKMEKRLTELEADKKTVWELMSRVMELEAWQKCMAKAAASITYEEFLELANRKESDEV